MAEYSWNGLLRYRDNPTDAVALARGLAKKSLDVATVTSIFLINANLVNSMMEDGELLYPPMNRVTRALLIPLDVWNRN